MGRAERREWGGRERRRRRNGGVGEVRGEESEEGEE